MRAFLALTPPDALVDALSALLSALNCGRHVDDDDLHLTLAFFPEVTLAELEELNLTLEMMRPGAVPLHVTGLGTFGSSDPRSLHAAVAPDPALMYLQKKVETAARRSGIDLPHRRFVPHITLARFPNRMPPEDHARIGRFLEARGNFRFDPVAVDEVALIQSTLGPDGARYDLLESYPIA
ncbi:2'-5' RNA ligase [Palleronia marisminoris]|uniref:RNA 2',3'-cyclic phosphodiesterase n=1 Tax=Palleronia marisminoris TaxID=315423 RepID=A0A1Y5RSD6_9RHOB|nr:RNA 2',3'-cyclic phosphodiesterase [Palleronia marisminoris]SFG51514.1 2'-5' RNA ligase [Palleronia marisminoris]SLN24282.1 2',5' RNA ligase family [Palleronia marisminoris]